MDIRELSCPLFDLCTQIVDVSEIDACDDDGRETLTTRLLSNQTLQTFLVILDVRRIPQLSQTHTDRAVNSETSNLSENALITYVNQTVCADFTNVTAERRSYMDDVSDSMFSHE